MIILRAVNYNSVCIKISRDIVEFVRVCCKKSRRSILSCKEINSCCLRACTDAVRTDGIVSFFIPFVKRFFMSENRRFVNAATTNEKIFTFLYFRGLTNHGRCGIIHQTFWKGGRAMRSVHVSYYYYYTAQDRLLSAIIR